MRGASRPRRWARVLRLLGWNVLLLTIGLALIAAAGEAWLRLTKPFMHRFESRSFVPGVGMHPTRNTAGSDCSTVSGRLPPSIGP